MGRKIICDSCETAFREEYVRDAKVCPYCGASWDDGGDTEDNTANLKEKTIWYYYDEGGGNGTLTDVNYNNDMFPNKFVPLHTFEATGLEDARRQLKEVLPNSSLFQSHASPTTKCPRCGSKEVQLVPRKFSLLTGFATNKFDRMCVYCKKKF